MTSMTEPELASIAERVAEGMEFLDAKLPGWRTHLNLKQLDMAAFPTCVAGQLRAYGLDVYVLCGCNAAKMIGLGFDVPFTEKADYPALTAAWKRAL